ncbi:DsbA family protein [Agrobacterium sp. P15N1-A]
MKEKQMRKLATLAVLLGLVANPATLSADETSWKKNEINSSYYVSGIQDAPITLVVYSSPTCSHCVDFHRNELEALKRDFVEKNVLKVIYRPYVRNSVDAVIFMLSKAHGGDRYFETLSYFMSRFEEIAAADDTETALRKIATELAIDRTDFDLAISDQAYLDELNAGTKQAQSEVGVTGTPTFFIDDQPINIRRSFKEVSAAVAEKAGMVPASPEGHP